MSNVDPHPASDPLDQLLDHMHAVDAIGAMLLASFGGYGSHPGQTSTAVAAEYVCYRLLRRETIEPRASVPKRVLVEDLVLRAEAGALADIVPPAIDDSDPSGMELDPLRRFAVHQLAVYDPAIPDLEERRWRDLFDGVAEAVESALGISLDAIWRITQSLMLRDVGWSLMRAGITESPSSAATAMGMLRHAVAAGAATHVDPGSGQHLAAPRAELLQGALVTQAELDAYLQLYATTSVPSGAGFAEWVWELRRRPVVVWNDRITLPVPFDLIMALRPTLESALRTHDVHAAGVYDDHKGKWVEREALSLMIQLLEPDQSFRALKVPAQGTGNVDPERDALLRLDMLAVAMEVKGGGISLSARRGRADSQDKTLQRLVHEGVAQADSLIAALQAGDKVTGVDLAPQQRVQVDIGNISRWMPLVVTLEDMSGVVAGSRATFAGRDPASPLPLVLTLDDLTWYGRELPLVAQFVHYLVVRERIARSRARIVVHDEADWFCFYLSRGGAGVQEWLDAFAELDVQVLTRGASGRRGAPDPRLNRWRTPHAALLDRWRQEGTDGWLEASLAMLDLSDEQSAQLPELIQSARQQAVEANALALVSIVPAGDPAVAIHIGVPAEPLTVTADQLASPISANAPNARNHVLLHATSRDPDDLHLWGVAIIQKAD